MTVQALLLNGLGSGDAALLAIRVCVGWFFAVSGAHKLFAPSRRRTLAATLAADGLTFPAMIIVVPVAELIGGVGVALGALTILAALGLVGLCVGALRFDGLKRIREMRPLDAADRAGDLLYLPEALYIVCLLAVISFGPGDYSVDRFALR